MGFPALSRWVIIYSYYVITVSRSKLLNKCVSQSAKNFLFSKLTFGAFSRVTFLKV